ncbi:MAG: hypothetical protein KKE20_05705, partial [Nanoarchaeota archaeon]|nr:hypothetical protein [Nanoarchaeota archaeon]
RRKLFFSILLSVLVAVMTFNKVRLLHEAGQSISNFMLAVTFLVCFVSLYLAIIRKNPYYSAKQIGSVFMILMLISLISTSGYSLADLAFISMIITTVALLIYDVF